MNNKYELPYLAELFQLLQTGMHICVQDGGKFFALQEKPTEYTSCFKALGYELLEHPKDFYYFQMQGKANNDSTKQMALFVFLLIEHLDKREIDLENAMMSTRFQVSTLPHLKTERYRELMREVKVIDEEGLVSVIAILQRYGFATLNGREAFQFKAPVYRFFDLCVSELASQGETEEVRG